MISYTRIYIEPTEALVYQARKNRLVSLMKILVWSGGHMGNQLKQNIYIYRLTSSINYDKCMVRQYYVYRSFHFPFYILINDFK